MRRLFHDAGLLDIESRPIDVPTTFTSFDDYWQPFLGGQGPAPGYVAGLSAEHRERLRLARALGFVEVDELVQFERVPRMGRRR